MEEGSDRETECEKQKMGKFGTILRTLERRRDADADGVICGGHPDGQYRIAGKD
jgi:hypothetical protein